ncbi:MAG: D-alanyl-D-alanine carboxypeptidase [Epulopiscium sp.]|nr:D-alanyl-D-alanine carboxypeptidase [Candidatus Epulonipiscium sp.]
MKRKFLCLCICLIATLSNIHVYANPVTEESFVTETESQSELPSQELDLEADSAILMDATTGEILYEKNIHKKQYPASITKLMTVLLAFESDHMSDTITFSHNAVFGIERGSSHIAIDVGEQITMEQALYAIMLRSANEVSLGVAEQVGGSIDAFCKDMTKRAKELGCKNTNFVNPNGLHDENHYTTAYDMALIAKELLKFDHFKEIMGTLQYQIPPTNKQPETRYLYAQHQMIKPPSLYCYEGCEGGKTGYTNEALNTLVTYAKRQDTELIAVVFKCKGAGHYVDTTNLFDYGFENFETKKILDKSSFSKEIPVMENYKKKTTQVGTVTLVPKQDFYKTLPKNTNTKNIQQQFNYEEQYTAPVKTGDVLGTVTFLLQQKKIGSVELIAKNSVDVLSTEDRKTLEKSAWLKRFKYAGIALGIVIVLAGIMFCVRQIASARRKRRRRRRRYSAARKR